MAMHSRAGDAAAPDLPNWALALKNLTESRPFHRLILGAILLAAAIIGLESYPELTQRWGELLRAADRAILALFTVEILLRLGAHGTRPWRFFRDPWNVFDFVIVVVCLLPVGEESAAVVRLLRILRVLRLISAVPRLQLLVTALLRGLPSIGYVVLLLLMLFYVYGSIGTALFAGNDPGHFGNLHRAMLSLLRAVTLEDWTDLMYTQMYGSDVFPPEIVPGEPVTPRASPVAAALFFGSFVVLGTMIMLNLFIGVVIGSMNEAQREQAKRAVAAPAGADLPAQIRTLEAELDAVRERLGALRRTLDGPGSGGA